MAEHIPYFVEMSKCEYLNTTDIIVYGAVYFYSFNGEKTFNQSYDTTAGKIGLTKNTIKNSLKKLDGLGIISDLTPDRRNAPHDYKPIWIPEFGTQKLVSIAEKGYQNLVPRIPKNGTQKAKRIPKFGTNKKTTKNYKNGAGEKTPAVEDDKPKPKTELMDTFIEATGLKMPTRKTDIRFWWSSIGELYNIADKDVSIGKKMIDFTIKQMTKNKLVISDPNSIIKTARPIMAKRAQRGSNEFQPISDDEPSKYLNKGVSIG